ncbi:hypothetical protein JW707_04315 [Candidatus Woesearchaeota archaeon]|nr:hypothetical protein [Candidatus Woesearchaeota archaeon]
MENNQYFEGILQLRNCPDEVVSFVRKIIESEKGVWVAKEAKVRGGVDFYLSSNKFLKKIGKLLKSKFIGLIKESAKLHTEDKQAGKKLYRGTILFKMPGFAVGDIGTFRGDEIKILSIGNKVAVQNTRTGEKASHKFDEMNKSFRVS